MNRLAVRVSRELASWKRDRAGRRVLDRICLDATGRLEFEARGRMVLARLGRVPACPVCRAVYQAFPHECVPQSRGDGQVVAVSASAVLPPRLTPTRVPAVGADSGTT